MTQYMRPCSDINEGFECSSGSSRYALIDEEAYNDYDYIYGTAPDRYSISWQACLLSTPGATPGSGTGTLRFRAALLGTALCVGSIWVGDFEDGTEIKTKDVSPGSYFEEFTIPLTEEEMANITNWADVRVVFLTYWHSKQTSPGTFYVSWAQFEVPDGATATAGLEMGMMF